jgi:hypothetical protein
MMRFFHGVRVGLRPLFHQAIGLAAGVAILTFGAAGARAIDEGLAGQKYRVAPSAKEKKDEVSFENNASFSAVSGSRMKSGSDKFGHVSELQASAESVMTRQLEEDLLLRMGTSWERFSFGRHDHAPLPGTLQSANMVLGVDWDISEEWLMRVETHPGVYSDYESVGLDDANSPVIIGFSWLKDKDLQWFFGLSVDLRRDIPVLPGIGVRWKFADQWTLMAVPPDPQIQFDLNEAWTLYAGGHLKAGTYHINDILRRVHQKNLDDSMLDYVEGRLGVGVKWKLRPNVELTLDGGSMVYRKFEFHTEDVIARGRPSLYGQLGFVANF